MSPICCRIEVSLLFLIVALVIFAHSYCLLRVKIWFTAPLASYVDIRAFQILKAVSSFCKEDKILSSSKVNRRAYAFFDFDTSVSLVASASFSKKLSNSFAANTALTLLFQTEKLAPSNGVTVYSAL
ncbi:hypothetical protein AVEN_219699-1 [Araneus ventricosus]|uniref:Uncharacterized protein n=1 Tax=Araneus ventricosus TaxID=182803 RepID=A0A4Y2V0X7_ARAVE|nr:hypothetical protein AVEN_210192-1 [Araneus ventricosus]GBO17546.1 hypothetical protein AVEN_172267-1 [Araneus ventricosus]GBO17550.1 hypothetical protein AVEN_186943-1 [Araneus ventricosus]GBO17553.1 hypothetical protein AVEN_219699-1 [Araneus ventricosus]